MGSKSFAVRFSAWPAGAVSGALGGLVGNQGGIRSAAMLGLNVKREAFVATATGIALIVDLARLPVYLYTDGDMILKLWPTVLAATLACVLGTFAGADLLRRIPEFAFRRVLGAVLIVAAALLMIERPTK